MRMNQQIAKAVVLVALGLAFAAGAAYAQGAPPPTGPCLAQDNGTGTVTLPPNGCEYLSPDQVHMIIDGLPPGTTIILKPLHRDFICGQGGGVAGKCITQGGPLGGEVENFNSSATFQLSVSGGTGTPLDGWTRTVTLPLAVETATAPRQAGAQVQTFNTDMQRIQGSITNDPDFALFEVVGGSANGYPSPGSTTLTKQTNGLFKVDSSFKVGYRIRFIGTTTGRLAGASGTTEGSVVMTAVKPCPAGGCPCP